MAAKSAAFQMEIDPEEVRWFELGTDGVYSEVFFDDFPTKAKLGSPNWRFCHKEVVETALGFNFVP